MISLYQERLFQERRRGSRGGTRAMSKVGTVYVAKIVQSESLRGLKSKADAGTGMPMERSCCARVM